MLIQDSLLGRNLIYLRKYPRDALRGLRAIPRNGRVLEAIINEFCSCNVGN